MSIVPQQRKNPINWTMSLFYRNVKVRGKSETAISRIPGIYAARFYSLKFKIGILPFSFFSFKGNILKTETCTGN